MADVRAEQLRAFVKDGLTLTDFTQHLINATYPKGARICEKDLLKAWGKSKEQYPEISKLIDAAILVIYSQIETNKKRKEKLEQRAIATWSIFAEKQIKEFQ